MTIHRAMIGRKRRQDVDASIGMAADARKAVIRGRNELIPLTIALDALAKVGETASPMRQSGAALINRAICELAERT